MDVYFQLNTEWTQLEVIDLINDGSGLGFGIIGGKSTGVVVKTLLPGGIADRVGIFSLSPPLPSLVTYACGPPLYFPIIFCVSLERKES